MAQTTTSSLSTDVTTHQALMYYALRPELYFDPVADVGNTNQTHRGNPVVFYITSDLAAATSTLTEGSDVTAVALADSTVSLTLAEYGNAVQTTALLRATSFLDVNPTVANVLGFNAGLSIDTLAATAINALAAGQTIHSNNGTTAGTFLTSSNDNLLAATDTLTGNMVRWATAKLRGANVMPWGGTYRGFMHPDVAYDFRGSTGGTNWSDPHIYSSPEGIWNGVIGTFQGVTFVETPRAPLSSDVGDGSGGAGTIDGYSTLIVGRQCLAKAHATGDGYGPFPSFVESPVTDSLKRFTGAGWKWLAKYGLFRATAGIKLRSASSIGANS